MKIPTKGFFIAFEGIDGSGKTFQCKKLESGLKPYFDRISLVREPTDGKIGILIRQILSDISAEFDERVLSMLFTADRLDHYIKPAVGISARLAQGEIIISDRCYLSSYAYQSLQLPLEDVVQINQICRKICRPNLHIFIDIEPEIAIKRIQTRGDDFTAYETKEKLSKIYENYKKAIEYCNDSEKIITINGNGTPQEIADEILAKVLAEIREEN